MEYELVAFDVDGTLIEGPEGMTVWEVLNLHYTGTADHNIERFAAYKSGKLSYAEWVALDIKGWRDAGARKDDLLAALSSLRVIKGVRETLAELDQEGVLLYAISGTLDVMLETLLPDHPFREVYANHIGFDGKGRIAHWRPTPFDMRGKAQALRALSVRQGVPLSRCAFVGDSSNDVWVARTAGLAIAFNPKCEELETIAGAVVHSKDLRDILPHLR